VLVNRPDTKLSDPCRRDANWGGSNGGVGQVKNPDRKKTEAPERGEGGTNTASQEKKRVVTGPFQVLHVGKNKRGIPLGERWEGVMEWVRGGKGKRGWGDPDAGTWVIVLWVVHPQVN